MNKDCTLVWFRRDLRLDDNPALRAAIAAKTPVVPLFIWSPEEEGAWSPGPASRWWLHQSLEALSGDLKSRGSRLILRKGSFLQTLTGLLSDIHPVRVLCNRIVEPGWLEIEEQISTLLRAEKIPIVSFNGSLLAEPGTLLNRQGRPFQVFTPFWKTLLRVYLPEEGWTAPRVIPAPKQWPDSLPLEALALEPKIDWAGGIRATWTPGEKGAHTQLSAFIKKRLETYPEGRDFPAQSDTSRLSPYLHFGEISPHAIWHCVADRAAFHPHPGLMRGEETFLRQLAWREFAHHLLFHFPHTAESPLRPEFSSFPWRHDPTALEAWQKGLTGYPIVDAGMRELWRTGWMHNRVRMIAGSFLVKDLLLPWQKGAQWFWHTLVDADLANNTLGWQWVAGCGADAAPYFRIFNPVVQGQKFDPEGVYVRRWVPELAQMPVAWIHHPWDAPLEILGRAKVKLGISYPWPIVEHGTARIRALAGLDSVKRLIIETR
ncbi:MAG TPA: deoxyribodipyrimidine photo-lyase [Candidatus Hydrogenedentes bacterium]|nr:deoxyribodipyrimidine photo-lyase [Candidatus Hydrogenedentota bacterium]